MAAGLPFWDPQELTFVLVDKIPGTEMPLALQPFGLLVAAGVLVGAHLMRRWGRARGLDDEHIRALVIRAVVVGFIGAHLFDVLFYQWDKLAQDPALLVRIWSGISSYGGVIGGVTGFLLYARSQKLDIWRYGDGAMVGFVPGFTFGRLGCTVVHDHIGAASDGFFLAVDYPPDFAGGVAGLHHNLGFYEFLYMLVLCGVLWGINRWKDRPDGFMVAAMATGYAPVRFFLEFLRVNPEADPRYVGLTFAQWVSMAMVVIGVLLMRRQLRGASPSGPDQPQATAQGAGSGSSKGKRAGESKSKSKRDGGGKKSGKRESEGTGEGTGKSESEGTGKSEGSGKGAGKGKSGKRRKKK